ncbi:MAG TPA: hypothetical protein VNH82_09375 [Candidatus Dormibacteraeota bacterium]|nr:hypothetical protein [Candidatus Dormibacteraeota bacterium]
MIRTHRPAHPGIGLGDYLVAAPALVGGLELVTFRMGNVPMFEGHGPPF